MAVTHRPVGPSITCWKCLWTHWTVCVPDGRYRDPGQGEAKSLTETEGEDTEMQVEKVLCFYLLEIQDEYLKWPYITAVL